MNLIDLPVNHGLPPAIIAAVEKAHNECLTLIGEDVLYGKVERSKCVETYSRVMGMKLTALEKIHGTKKVLDVRIALKVNLHVD